MSKASDNPFPSLLFADSAAPANPAAAHHRLFIDTADGLLKSIDSTGTVTVQGGGVANLADLADVDLTGLADGDVLVWDTTTSKWIVAAAGGGVSTLAALTDIDLTGLADGDMIVWDTTTSKWIVATPAAGGGGGAAVLDDLTDVDTTTSPPSGGEVLWFDGALWVSHNYFLSNLFDVDGSTDAPTTGDILTYDGSVWGAAPAAGGGTASGTTFTPAGGLSSTNVQAALVELDTEKAALASPAFTGNPTAPTPAAGDNDTSVATTAFVAAAVAKQAEVLMFALSDEATALTTGTKLTFRIPYAFTVTEVRASLTTAASSGTPAFDVKKNGTTIFSTALTIDATEKTSKTAATAAVLSTTALADDDEIALVVTTAGTAAAGAKLTLIGTRT